MSLRVGFLGAGLIATYHSKSLHRSGEDVVWSGVYDPVRSRAEAFSAASGAPVCSSEEEVLETAEAVYICTWTSEHRRLVEAAAARGLGVFCEKPLSVDLGSARAMAATVAAAGVTNQVGLVLRSSPAMLAAARVIADPASGRVMSVVFRDDQYIPVKGMYASTWRGEVDKAGAGTLLEHSIHDVDVLSWLIGPMTSVQARSSGFHAITGIEDTVGALIGFDGGAVGTLTSVWHDVTVRPSLRRIEVFCERAWCAVEGDWWGPVSWTRADGSEGRLEGGELAELAGPIDPGGYAGPGNPDGAFVRATLRGAPAGPDFAAAVQAHVVVDAMYRSAADGGATVTLAGGAREPR